LARTGSHVFQFSSGSGMIEPCSEEELKQFAEMSKWLKENDLRLRCRRTAKPRGLDPIVYLVDKNTNMVVAKL